MYRQPAVPSCSPHEAARLVLQPSELAPGASGPGEAVGSTSPGDPRGLLVDVRERDEFLDVRAPGAVLYPLSSMAFRVDELPRDRPLLVVCAHGERSQGATAYLLRRGFADVRSVAGGMAEWLRAGLPYRRGALAEGEGLLHPGRG
jgi:rhodanese-related sulfurtransferase